MSRIVAVILAAGKGSRLGGPKALLAWPVAAPSRGGGERAADPRSTPEERPLAIAHAEERLASESTEALIVTRRPWLGALLRYVRPGIDLVASDAEEELGPAGSIACAVSRLGEVTAVILTPVDTVPARKETIAKLLARLDADPALLAVRPSYHGRGGHPVVVRAPALSRYRDPAPPPLRDHLKTLGEKCAFEEVADATVLIDLNKPADVMGVLRSMPRFVSH